MYFNKNNNFFHGITFHHFHDNYIHKPGQGSISKDEFYKIIKFIGRNNIINADEFLSRLKENKLKNTDICLTFDDGCKSQYDIALPVLEDLKIKSFFFIYSSIFENNPDLFEVYRFFRINFFNNIDAFYNFFFKKINYDIEEFLEKKRKEIEFMKKKFPYYSSNDIKFRFVRNNFLTENEYKNIMLSMMKKKKFNFRNYFNLLFINKRNLKKIKKLGHKIGLHSHSHPMTMANLSYDKQFYEYDKNISLLSKILNINKNSLDCASYPAGSYNANTIKVFKTLGIKIGFKNIIFSKNDKQIKNSLQIPRQDHAEIMRKLKLKKINSK